MKFFFRLDLSRFLRDQEDSEGRRRLRRLPVRIPLLYRVPGNKSFHECSITDVSRDGIGVVIMDLSPAERRKAIRKNTPIEFRIRLAGHRNWVSFHACVRWARPEPQDGPSSYFIGFQYKGTPFNTRLDILHRGLRLVRRRRLLWAAGAVLFLGLCVVSVMAIRSESVAKKTRAELVVSENRREELRREVVHLTGEADQMLAVLRKNREALIRQKELLSEREESLRSQSVRAERLEQGIRDRMAQTDALKKDIAGLEEQMRERTEFLESLQKMIDEVGRELDVGSSDSFRLLFLDSRYEQAKGLIAAGKLREAQSVLRSLRRRFPGSIVVHRMLYSVLMKDERTEEADKLFRDFMKQQRESWKPEP